MLSWVWGMYLCRRSAVQDYDDSLLHVTYIVRTLTSRFLYDDIESENEYRSFKIPLGTLA